MITAVDSMKARRSVFENCTFNWLIDPRMSAEYCTLNVVRMDGGQKEWKAYEATLFDDSEGVQERCTAKSTMYTVQSISGLVCKAVKDITMGKPYVRSLDWNIEKNAMVAFSNEGNKL